MSRGRSVRGVGVGFRPELAHDLLTTHAERSRAGEPPLVDFLEVVAETLFARVEWRKEAIALAEVWPVVPHGVKLSLASADGVDEDKARRLGELARELRAPVITEHVALTRAGRRDLGHLTAVPFTNETVAIVARNVARARRHLPDVPFLLENPAWTLRYAGDAMGEGEFHRAIVERTGCGMLLDVANVYANARNAGLDPMALLESHPLEAVRMVHVAGGVFEDGFWFDTHAHAVPEDVFAMAARVIEVCGDVPLVLERDGNYPPFAELARELETMRALHEGASPSASAMPPLSAGTSDVDDATLRRVAAEQDALAAALVSGDAAPVGVDSRAIERTRAVLREKRIDDALPLLPRLSLRRAEVEPLVRAALSQWPRPDALVGPADAMRIAALASSERALAEDACFDRLLLRARFAGPDVRGDVRPRRAPFVGKERVGARTIWAIKGPGASAPVRLHARGGRS